MDKQMMSMDELEQVNGGKFAGASGHSINLGKLLFGDEKHEPDWHGPADVRPGGVNWKGWHGPADA